MTMASRIWLNHILKHKAVKKSLKIPEPKQRYCMNRQYITVWFTLDLKRRAPDYYFYYLQKTMITLSVFKMLPIIWDSTSFENVIYLWPLLRLEFHSDYFFLTGHVTPTAICKTIILVPYFYVKLLKYMLRRPDLKTSCSIPFSL